MLVVLGLCAAVAAVSIPIAYVFFDVVMAHLYALSLVFGVLGAWWPVWNAFLPAVVERDRIVDANSSVFAIVGASTDGYLDAASPRCTILVASIGTIDLASGEVLHRRRGRPPTVLPAGASRAW